MELDTPIIGAAAALAGSVVGACASVAATLLGQRLQARGTRLMAELDEREQLYGRFVEEAMPMFVEASEGTKVNPAKVIQLYSLVARIRLTSGDEVLRAAEEVGKRLLDAYERPPEDAAALIARYARGEESLNPLGDFTEACRRERARIIQQNERRPSRLSQPATCGPEHFRDCRRCLEPTALRETTQFLKHSGENRMQVDPLHSQAHPLKSGIEQ